MLKKVLIAGVAVVLALLVVSYVVPRRFADACLWLKERRDAAEESIPPEREIAILKAKIDALAKDDEYQFHHVAKLSAEVKGDERLVNQSRDRLVNSEKRIGAMHAALKVEGLQVNYESRRWAREELKTEFETSVDAYRREEQQLRAQETALAAKRQTLEVARTNLAEMRLTREQLKADLETLRAELALEQQAAAQERKLASDPKAAEAREKLESIRKRISVMKEERTLRRELKTGGSAVKAHEEQKKQQEERDAFINQRWGGAVDATSAKR
jgi:chromosome segregation ATPase